MSAQLNRRDARRDSLLDVAAAIVATQDVDAVSMEGVAEKAGVSRPLVYKHFSNRTELLEALYAREADALHRAIGGEVAKAESLDDMFRALVRGSLAAQAERGATFAALRAVVGRTDARRKEQRDRDRGTLMFFVRQVVHQFDLGEAQARAAVSIMLGAIDSVLNVFRVRPTQEHAALLEETYVTLVRGGLTALKGAPA